MTGRLIIMLVVLTAVVATRPPVVAHSQAAAESARSTWIGKLAVGVTGSITRSALLHRIAFGVPKSPLRVPLELDTRPVRNELPDPFRYCLPPPTLA